MKKVALLVLFVISFALQCMCAEESEAEIVNLNPGFEDEMSGWKIDKERDLGISKISPLAARTGKMGLRIEDDNPSGSAQIESNWYNAIEGGKYKITLWANVHSGCGFWILLIFADSNGKWILFQDPIPERQIAKLVVPRVTNGWEKFELLVIAPKGTAKVRMNITTWGPGRTLTDLDDVTLTLEK